MALGTGHWALGTGSGSGEKHITRQFLKPELYRASRITDLRSRIFHRSSRISHLASAPSGAGNEIRTVGAPKGGVPIVTPWGSLFY